MTLEMDEHLNSPVLVLSLHACKKKIKKILQQVSNRSNSKLGTNRAHELRV